MLLKKSVPNSFIDIYSLWQPEEKQNKLEGCQQSLFRVLFNNNTADGFWTLFEKIYKLIVANPEYDVQTLFIELKKERDFISICLGFDVLSLKYFIAIVKDGIQQ